MNTHGFLQFWNVLSHDLLMTTLPFSSSLVGERVAYTCWAPRSIYHVSSSLFCSPASVLRSRRCSLVPLPSVNSLSSDLSFHTFIGFWFPSLYSPFLDFADVPSLVMGVLRFRRGCCALHLGASSSGWGEVGRDGRRRASQGRM